MYKHDVHDCGVEAHHVECVRGCNEDEGLGFCVLNYPLGHDEGDVEER